MKKIIYLSICIGVVAALVMTFGNNPQTIDEQEVLVRKGDTE